MRRARSARTVSTRLTCSAPSWIWTAPHMGSLHLRTTPCTWQPFCTPSTTTGLCTSYSPLAPVVGCGNKTAIIVPPHACAP
jgi:hypothetical protein